MECESRSTECRTAGSRLSKLLASKVLKDKYNLLAERPISDGGDVMRAVMTLVFLAALTAAFTSLADCDSTEQDGISFVCPIGAL
jgi:hypothetical protein